MEEFPWNKVKWVQDSLLNPHFERLKLRKPEPPPGPKLWDVPPDMGIVHIAGAQMIMFGRYLRQRCDWCGIILLEYDLQNVAVSGPDRSMPAMWPVQSLVLVDGNMSTVWETVTIEGTTDIKLPMNACAFNPLTQVGM